MFFNIINLPRTPLDQREGMQLWHDSLGWVVGIVCLARLYWFAAGPEARVRPRVCRRIPSLHSRAILFMLVLVFAAEFLIGIFYAWGEAA